MDSNTKIISVVVALSAVLGLGVLWVASELAINESADGGPASVSGASGPPRMAGSAGSVVEAPGRRAGDPVVRDLQAEAKERPQNAATHRLATERDPELEADPEFHKLMEIDSTRKMALVDPEMAKNDPDGLKNLRREITSPESKISRGVLKKALLDPNPEVRLAALSEISLSMDEIPVDMLAPVVSGDPDAEVRLEALEIVAESETDEALAVIRSAANDPDDDVRTEAEDLLYEMAEETF